MKKFILLLAMLFLFTGLTFAKLSSNYSVKYHKSGGKTVKTENITTKYDKNENIQNKSVKSGNTTTNYDKNGKKKSKSVKTGNSTYTYDGKGKLKTKETKIKY